MKRDFSFAGDTNLGMVRSNNEDAFLVQTVWDDKHILAVAIDGVGGYEGGEVAAAIARESIAAFLADNSEGEKSELLRRAVIYANNEIYEQRLHSSENANMSCVLTAALIDTEEQFVNMAHIGDTRLYQYSDGEFVKLSHDHSLVGYREEIGDLTEEEAMHHPQRNIISRDVGSRFLQDSEEEYVEVDSFPLIPNSIFLLCSDGLCDMITSAEMKSVLVKEIPVEEKVEELISKANAAGGRDNVTVVVVEYFPNDDVVEKEPVNEHIVNADSEDTDVPEVDGYEIERKSFFSKYKVEIIGAVVTMLVLMAFAAIKFRGAPSQDVELQKPATPEMVVVQSAEDTVSVQESMVEAEVPVFDEEVPDSARVDSSAAAVDTNTGQL